MRLLAGIVAVLALPLGQAAGWYVVTRVFELAMAPGTGAPRRADRRCRRAGDGRARAGGSVGVAARRARMRCCGRCDALLNAHRLNRREQKPILASCRHGAGSMETFMANQVDPRIAYPAAGGGVGHGQLRCRPAVLHVVGLQLHGERRAAHRRGRAVLRAARAWSTPCSTRSDARRCWAGSSCSRRSALVITMGFGDQSPVGASGKALFWAYAAV